MFVHINTIQNEQLNTLADLTGIDKNTLLEEALGLFLERWEYVLQQDQYMVSIEVQHYNKIVPQNCTLEIDVTHAPGSAIAYFLIEHLSLNAISLSYVTRKALALLFDGKPVQKRVHI
ncbi:MAG: ribbon-helix-helix domain-containing protein [Alphaproteobacteria bacterium]|nr:ribbon-helix-helix domain-containing protein [Alphaproteobacteria bacterium]